MEKAFFLLMMALLIAVAGIPLAYWVGLETSRDRLSPELRAEIVRVRQEDRETIAALQRQLAGLVSEEPSQRETVTRPAGNAATSQALLDDAPAESPSDTIPSPETAAAKSEPVNSPPDMKSVKVPEPPAHKSDRPADQHAGCGPPIPESAFKTAEEGMTYDAVVDRFGREGAIKLTLEDVGGSVVEQYVWEWVKPDGSTGLVRVSFENGRLSDKVYAG